MWPMCSVVLISHLFPSPLCSPWPRVLHLALASPLALQAMASQRQEEGEASWHLYLGGALAGNEWGEAGTHCNGQSSRPVTTAYFTFNSDI